MMRPYALQDLITLPPILAAVLSRHGVDFAVQIEGSGRGVWRFQFERRAILRVEPGGAWAWQAGNAKRFSLDPIILEAAQAAEEAQQALAGLADHGDTIPASSLELSPSQLDTTCDGGWLFLQPGPKRAGSADI